MPSNPPPIANGVVKEPPSNYGLMGDYVLSFASFADEIPAFGSNPRDRDVRLRAFWPTEPILASAIYTTMSRYVAFGASFEGPDRSVALSQRMWNNVEWGQGPSALMSKALVDYWTQDNAAWIEIVRTEDSPYAPCITLKHLDSNRCMRTGRIDTPIIYFDMYGVGHVMKWYQVAELTDMPSPVEFMRGIQLCAVSRMLRAAQIMRDIQTYKREKISGRFHRAIHLVSGVQKVTIDDAIGANKHEADASGLIRYIQPLVIAALDPTKAVSVATIDLASLPDGFSEEDTMKWYINQLALAFGSDYQDYAPLPGGNLGSAQQSETLHLKSRGKGPRLFMQKWEHIMNNKGVLPSSVRFIFGDQDVAEDMQHSRLQLNRANTRKIMIDSGQITPEVAANMAVDIGDLKEEYLGLMTLKDTTPDVDESAGEKPQQISTAKS